MEELCNQEVSHIPAEANVHQPVVAGRWQREFGGYRRFSKMVRRGTFAPNFVMRRVDPVRPIIISLRQLSHVSSGASAYAGPTERLAAHREWKPQPHENVLEGLFELRIGFLGSISDSMEANLAVPTVCPSGCIRDN
jgi:hypothetical protein